MDSGQPALDEPTVALDGFLDGLTRLGGVASAVEALVVAAPPGVEAHPLYRRASGFRVGGEKLGPGCRFDAASLTKPWMATLALVLDARGVLALDAELGEILEPEVFREGDRTSGVSLEDLLRHRSGMAAWAPLGLLAARSGFVLSDRDSLLRLLLSESCRERTVESESPPSDARYSDLGYILWGLAAERATGRPLAELLDELVCAPLGVAPLGALAARPDRLPDPVECRLDNGKEVELAAAEGITLSPQRTFHLGVPQDGNARSIGYLTAHAGLFVTADEMFALGREWLRPSRLLSPEAREGALAGGGGYGLGWARWSAAGSSGPALPPASFGHTGFTGGSLWIDPERDRLLVLMAHRLSSRIDWNPFRREFHRLASALA